MIEVRDFLQPRPDRFDILIEDLDRLISPAEPREGMADSLERFMVDAHHLGLPMATIRAILESFVGDTEDCGLFDPLRQVYSCGSKRLVD